MDIVVKSKFNEGVSEIWLEKITSSELSNADSDLFDWNAVMHGTWNWVRCKIAKTTQR